MILRRFIKHVSDQNWFAVGLDVCVVIVGIFLGMQVTDWNERRQTMALERQYITQLIQEMEASHSSTDANISASLQSLNRGIAIHSALDSAAAIRELDEDLSTYFSGSFLIASPRLQTATLNHLVQSGELSKISSPALRTSLVNASEALKLRSRYANGNF